MCRTSIFQILFILIFSIFISNLLADQANQQKMEAQFRDETGFEGTIKWWNSDDTMKELEGYFPDMPISMDLEWDDNAANANEIFLSLVPYSGLKKEDFFPIVNGADFYNFNQKLNGRKMSNYGAIEFCMMGDGNIFISASTILKVNAPLNPKLTVDEAYTKFTQVAVPADIIPQSDMKCELTYIVPSTYVDNPDMKPTEYLLTWLMMAYDKWYYIDAITGKLVKKN